jgi:hypothetical protein
MLEDADVQCPYCGESFTTTVDCSAGSQTYIEDCQVCCQPIVFVLLTDHAGNMVALETRRDDE